MFQIIMDFRLGACLRSVRIPLQYTDKGRGGWMIFMVTLQVGLRY